MISSLPLNFEWVGKQRGKCSTECRLYYMYLVLHDHFVIMMRKREEKLSPKKNSS